MAAGPMLFFPLVALFGTVEIRAHHWVAAGYLLAFPLLGGLVSQFFSGFLGSRQASLFGRRPSDPTLTNFPSLIAIASTQG